VPAWSTVFRESSIESRSVAPFSVINPEDAVQIIGGRPVIGSENIRRHARRKVREPRPPQRHISFPTHTPQVSRFWWGRPPGLRATPRSPRRNNEACRDACPPLKRTVLWLRGGRSAFSSLRGTGHDAPRQVIRFTERVRSRRARPGGAAA
jgi:hypothetical protein